MLRLLRARVRLVRSSAERGVALAMVVGIASVLLLLISLSMTFAVSGLVRSDHDADWDAAMSAAYAGVADYQGRMTNDPSYYQWGNKNAPFTIANGSAATVKSPPTPNPAFDIVDDAHGGSWAQVKLTDSLPVNAYYRYEVDNSKFQSNGVLRLRSTGKVGTVTRSVVANIKQAGFTNYVYFTDYELLDPAVNTKSCTVLHAWENPSLDTDCIINFVTQDTLDGQVHSNDTLNICGGTFKKRVTTANPKRTSGKLYSQIGCSGTPVFSAGQPENASLYKIPSVQQQLDQVRADLPDKVPNPGCLYTGPTRITFTADGSMKVYSPWTKHTQTKAANGYADPPYCGKPGDPSKTATQNAGTLADPTGGQTIPIGASSALWNNLVYVQSIPGSNLDPNYWAPGTTPNRNEFSCGSTGNGIGFPVTGESVSSKIPYGCSAGDVFIQGTMHGSMTVNADNFAFITGKLVYQDTANDMLGLVGANSVWVWNPVKCTTKDAYGDCTAGTSLTTWEASATSTDCARTIMAAILSNDHSFEVQNYKAGKRGYLCVTGSIAQKFRGPVGLTGGASGFFKSYSYDPRLLNTPPPRFPTPRTTSYDVTTEIEVKTAFASNGAPL